LSTEKETTDFFEERKKLRDRTRDNSPVNYYTRKKVPSSPTQLFLDPNYGLDPSAPKKFWDGFQWITKTQAGNKTDPILME
jgi:hypothetical protein